MIDLVFAKLILSICGLLGTLLLMILLLDFNDRERIEHYYGLLLIGIVGVIFVILGLIVLW
ncbi:hypothetical protein [Lactococcus cremoris]|uniref:Uncharacterized protein n=1 Tax=Lactococcus lactis subsp. cremoris TaxID=1359 RepID=A0AAD1K1A4_LACLC|nr:hypothetical protein [Lactococcus cremoris]BBC77158.1 transmembrane protein, putative [Lactococcus cremoris]BCO04601.1 hypothetical protein LLG32_26950 [Lactococcus cremoris]BCO07445.1 hypothetical protein LLC_26850 [Lactococcus cremoris]